MKDASEKRFNNYEQMKSLAHTYKHKRLFSMQGYVYHVLSGQWLRKAFPGIGVDNRTLPEKRYRICLSEVGISEFPEESTDVFKRNMIDRYLFIDTSSQCITRQC